MRVRSERSVEEIGHVFRGGQTYGQRAFGRRECDLVLEGLRVASELLQVGKIVVVVDVDLFHVHRVVSHGVVVYVVVVVLKDVAGVQVVLFGGLPVAPRAVVLQYGGPRRVGVVDFVQDERGVLYDTVAGVVNLACNLGMLSHFLQELDWADSLTVVS